MSPRTLPCRVELINAGQVLEPIALGHTILGARLSGSLAPRSYSPLTSRPRHFKVHKVAAVNREARKLSEAPPERQLDHGAGSKKGDVRIAGTLLKLYRTAAYGCPTQQRIADLLHVKLHNLIKWEEGIYTPEPIQINPGVVAEALKLSAEETERLNGAIDADEFLRRLLRDKPENLHTWYLWFQSMLSVPVSEMRHWLRRIFLENNLGPESKQNAEKAKRNFEREARVEKPGRQQSAAKGKKDSELATQLAEIDEIGRQTLVKQHALEEIRQRLLEACDDPTDEHGKPVTSNDMSQLLLFLARSARNAQPDFRAKVLVTLQHSIKDEKNKPTTRRHLCDAISELEDDSYVCRYVKEIHETEGKRQADANANLAYLARMASDRGSGLETMAFLLRLFHAHWRMERVPMLALDLATMLRLVETPASETFPSPLPLGNLQDTLLLKEAAEHLFGAKPQWFKDHACLSGQGNYCQKIAVESANAILDRIREFGNGVSVRFSPSATESGTREE